MLSQATERLQGYSKRLKFEVAQWRFRRERSIRHDRYEQWIKRLKSDPPDVFLGPDLPYGGVRGHVRAIKKYSSLNIQLVPDETVMGSLGAFNEELRERFMAFKPAPGATVHSHVIPWFIDWCRRQQEHGSRWVHTYHLHYFPEHGENGILRPDQIAINEALLGPAREADVRLSVAKWQCDWLSREHGIETTYLPNGVDVEATAKGNADRFRKRHRLTAPFFLWVGRNDPVKDPASFVRLAGKMPHRHFVIIGADLNPDTVSTKWSLASPENLTYLGTMKHAQVQDAIAACSALVVTSFREGLPTLVLEAMAQARPVVAIEEEGSAEALGHGDFGSLVPRGDFSALAETIERAETDQARPRRARDRVLTEYDWRVVAPKLDAIYQGN